MKHYSYITQGTCSRQIDIDVDDNGCVQNVSFMGGCPVSYTHLTLPTILLV